MAALQSDYTYIQSLPTILVTHVVSLRKNVSVVQNQRHRDGGFCFFFKGTALSGASATLNIWNRDINSAKGPMGLTYAMFEWLAELVAKILF